MRAKSRIVGVMGMISALELEEGEPRSVEAGGGGALETVLLPEGEEPPAKTIPLEDWAEARAERVRVERSLR